MKTNVTIKLQQCLDDLGLKHAEAAKKAHTSEVQIGRLAKGERKMTMEWLLRLCGALDVTADKIVDIPLSIDKKNTDPVMVDSVIGFVLEACEKAKLTTTRTERGRWATFVFTAANEIPLNVHQTKALANVVVKFNKRNKK